MGRCSGSARRYNKDVLKGCMQKQIFLFLMILLYLSCALVGCQQSDQTGDRKSDAKSVQIGLLGYDFPLTVNQVINNIGAPDSTYIDNDEGCPFGQMHSWNVRDKNYTILVLGDSYGKKSDFSAQSRLFGLKKINSGNPSKFDGLLNIRLDDSSEEVKRKLESFVASNQTFHISLNSNRTVVLTLFCRPAKFKHQYILENVGTYIHFIINKENKLEAIIKASLNIFEAC